MIARVFPRKTSATPDDPYAFVGEPPISLPDDITEVHVSVVFSYDLKRAYSLAKLWERIAPVYIGGPATMQQGEEFVPGRYVKNGIVITSRGCPNRCWFCSVWRSEPGLVELPIRDGYIVQDDNLLACSKKHILAVFDMLKNQKNRPEFKGGLDARLLRKWHVRLLSDLNPKSIFFSYDTPDDKEPLKNASKLLKPFFTRHKLYCYCLIGFEGDTFEAARERLLYIISLGMTPFSMLYRDESGKTNADWRKFQRSTCRPAAIFAKNGCTALVGD